MRLGRGVFRNEMETAIDEEKDVTHRQLTELVVSALDDPHKYKLKMETTECEFMFEPTIQSGGVYETQLRKARSDERKLKHDVIIFSTGATYKARGPNRCCWPLPQLFI